MRGFIKVFTVIIIIEFILNVVQFTDVLAAEGKTAKIYDFSNSVTLIRSETSYKVFKGMRIKAGDIIETGVDSSVYIQIDNDKLVKLESSTKITVNNVSSSDKNSDLTITLSKGKILEDIKNILIKNPSNYVKTPNVVMGVRA